MFDFFRKSKKAAALDGIQVIVAHHEKTVAANPWLDAAAEARLASVTLKHVSNLVKIGMVG